MEKGSRRGGQKDGGRGRKGGTEGREAVVSYLESWTSSVWFSGLLQVEPHHNGSFYLKARSKENITANKSCLLTFCPSQLVI